MAPLILWSALVIVVYGIAYSLISTGASRLSDVNVNGRVLWQSECSEQSCWGRMFHLSCTMALL